MRFEFSPKAYYFPTGAELGTRSQLTAVFEAYGVQRALVVQPNSGYDDDNRCLIDVLSHGEGRFRGMAVIANDTSRRELERLRALRINGVTFNAAQLGVEYYAKTAGLLAELADLDMYVDLQVQADQLIELLPPIPVQRFVVDDALTGKQALDAIDVPDPLLQQHGAFAADAPAVLLFRGRCHNHRADTRFPTLPCQQRP